jgi:GTPase SAR1 family protein
MYKSLISNFYRNASLAMLVYAIDDKNSFINVTKWIKEIKLQSSPDIKMILIGNKADLENKRKVTLEEANKLKEENDILYFKETSAKSGINAKEVFNEAAKILYEEYIELAKKIKSLSLSKKESTFNDSSLNSSRLKSYINSKKKKRCCL